MIWRITIFFCICNLQAEVIDPKILYVLIKGYAHYYYIWYIALKYSNLQVFRCNLCNMEKWSWWEKVSFTTRTHQYTLKLGAYCIYQKISEPKILLSSSETFFSLYFCSFLLWINRTVDWIYQFNVIFFTFRIIRHWKDTKVDHFIILNQIYTANIVFFLFILEQLLYSKNI